jgi:hypothetical protein
MLLPIFALLLTVGTPAGPPRQQSIRAAPVSQAPAGAEQYRSKRYSYRAGARSSRKRPRYYSLKTKRGATILCKGTWRGSRSVRTCWRRH